MLQDRCGGRMESVMLATTRPVWSTLDTSVSLEQPPPALPVKALSRPPPVASGTEHVFELDFLPRQAESSARSENTVLPGDLEASRPATPTPTGSDHGDGEAVEAVQSVWDPHMNRYRFLSACLMNFGNGLNDSAVGALIPYMEKYVIHTHHGTNYTRPSRLTTSKALQYRLRHRFPHLC